MRADESLQITTKQFYLTLYAISQVVGISYVHQNVNGQPIVLTELAIKTSIKYLA